MGILSATLGIIGSLAVAIGFIILAFKLHWIFGIITTGLVLIIFAGLIYEVWLES